MPAQTRSVDPADDIQIVDNEADLRYEAHVDGELAGWIDYKPRDGWLIFVDGSTRGTVDGTDIRLKVGQPAVSDAVIDGGGDAGDTTDGNFDLYASYLPSGASKGGVGGNATGTIAICSPPGKRRNIVISATGRIRIEQPADAACP